MEIRYHLLGDFGIYKATIKSNFYDNDRGPEYAHVEELIKRRTQLYTFEEVEDLFGFLWTAHDDCVVENSEDFAPIAVTTAEKKIKRGLQAVAKLNSLRPLTDPQQFTISLFAQLEGHNWKSKLREMWETGTVDESYQTLYRLRNSHGPSWLDAYRLPQETK